MIGGSCLCGRVSYEFEAPTDHFVLCHCNRCKKSSGSAFLAGLIVSGLKFHSGAELIKSYEAPILLNPPKYRRDFCENCGSPVPSPFSEGNLHIVPAGTLDSDPGVEPTEHVWVDCEAPWELRIMELPRLTEAEFVLARVRDLEKSGAPDVAEHYRFIIEHYADDESAEGTVTSARARLSEPLQNSE